MPDQKKKVHTVWLHLYKTLQDTNLSIVTENRSVVAWWWGRAKEIKKGHKRTFGNYGYLDCGDGFFRVCVCVWTFIKLYTVNMCNLLYVNNSSLRLFKNHFGFKCAG